MRQPVGKDGFAERPVQKNFTLDIQVNTFGQIFVAYIRH